MNDALLMHKETEKQVNSMLNKPPHSILIIGSAGTGKSHLALYMSARLMQVPMGKLADQPYFIVLRKPDGKQEIPIEDVRGMIRKLALKTSGKNRIVLIDGAHNLSEEAQNALLKNMEEPSQNTHFILTSPAVSMILPTISSRSQKITVKPVTRDDALRYFGNDFDNDKIISAWNLSRGGGGLISALLADDDSHPIKASVEDAKRFIRMDRYERAIFLDKYSSDKNGYVVFLDALDRLLSALSSVSIKSDKPAQTSRILSSRRLVNRSLLSLSYNVSPRLISLNLAQKLNI